MNAPLKEYCCGLRCSTPCQTHVTGEMDRLGRTGDEIVSTQHTEEMVRAENLLLSTRISSLEQAQHAAQDTIAILWQLLVAVPYCSVSPAVETAAKQAGLEAWTARHGDLRTHIVKAESRSRICPKSTAP